MRKGWCGLLVTFLFVVVDGWVDGLALSLQAKNSVERRLRFYFKNKKIKIKKIVLGMPLLVTGYLFLKNATPQFNTLIFLFNMI